MLLESNGNWTSFSPITSIDGFVQSVNVIGSQHSVIWYRVESKWFSLVRRFEDKAVYGYGTSIPPNNNEVEDNEVSSPRKVIFCVHGKLSGCCTVVRGMPIDENAAIDYQKNSSSKFFVPTGGDLGEIFDSNVPMSIFPLKCHGSFFRKLQIKLQPKLFCKLNFIQVTNLTLKFNKRILTR